MTEKTAKIILCFKSAFLSDFDDQKKTMHCNSKYWAITGQSQSNYGAIIEQFFYLVVMIVGQLFK